MEASLALADRAHEVFQQIVGLRQQIEVRFLALGQLLAEVRGDELYLACGVDTFEAFLGIPEVGLSRSHAYRLIEVAATFGAAVPPVGQTVNYNQLAAIGVRKLAALVPVVRADPAMAAEWLNRAEALSASALREAIAEARGVERTGLDEWIERRFRAIQHLAQQGIEGAREPGDAADAICAEAMRIRERVSSEGESSVHGGRGR